jgi:CheY-like chemotaxis protein
MNTRLSATNERSRGLRIFVVENHPDTLMSLCLYLEQVGHTVLSAKSMAEAVAALPSAHCDVLLSDIGLPDGEGWNLLKKVNVSPFPYAIAMSGFGMNADRDKSKAAGFRHHLLKPFIPADLEVMLEEARREKEAREISSS